MILRRRLNEGNMMADDIAGVGQRIDLGCYCIITADEGEGAKGEDEGVARTTKENKDGPTEIEDTYNDVHILSVSVRLLVC